MDIGRRPPPRAGRQGPAAASMHLAANVGGGARPYHARGAVLNTYRRSMGAAPRPPM